MIFPDINMNGTSVYSLREQYEAVYKACGPLLEALYAAMPHARDYTPQGSMAGMHKATVAQEEMRERIAKVRSIKEDMEKLFEYTEGKR